MAIKTKVNPLEEALKRATASYDQGGKEYTDYLLAGGGIRDALSRAMAEATPQVGQVRAERNRAQERLGTVFANSQDELKGEADPFAREKIRALRSAQFTREANDSGGILKDLEADREAQVGKFANVFGAITSAKEFDVNRRKEALDRARGDVTRTEDRAFDTRFDDLTRREKEASIAASNRSNRGSGSGVTDTQALNDPLLEMKAKGVRRVPKADGGFDFFGPDGKPITVEQAAAYTTFGTPAALLANSSNAQDTQRIAAASGKQESVESRKLSANASTGLASVGQIEKLLDNSDLTKNLTLSRVPFGAFNPQAQLIQNANHNIMDTLSRLRTGAGITKNEEHLYRSFVPNAGDSPESRAQKLATLRNIFTLARGNPSAAQSAIEAQIGGETVVTDMSAFESH